MSQLVDNGAPEWKQKAENKTFSYGIISNKSLKEQRESLPIYILKTELMQAIVTNQVLVVIGETGSWKVTQMTQYMVEMGMTKKGLYGLAPWIWSLRDGPPAGMRNKIAIIEIIVVAHHYCPYCCCCCCCCCWMPWARCNTHLIHAGLDPLQDLVASLE
jgi:hypothetical protein